MIDILYWYTEGALLSMIIVTLCALITGTESKEGIKTALTVGLIWPIAWPLCIYMVIKGRNKKQ